MLSASKEQRVERGELALFCRQFGGMLGAGVDLLGILDVLRKQSSNERLKEVLDSVERDVSLGRLLSTAVGRFPEIFSPFSLSILRPGGPDDTVSGGPGSPWAPVSGRARVSSRRYRGLPPARRTTSLTRLGLLMSPSSCSMSWHRCCSSSSSRGTRASRSASTRAGSGRR